MTNDTDDQLVQRIAGFIAERIPDGAPRKSWELEGFRMLFWITCMTKKHLGHPLRTVFRWCNDLVEKGIITCAAKPFIPERLPQGLS